MSGIVGIARFDGAQVDRDLIGGLTDAMAYRGPDSQQIWVDGSVGLGHALLQTAGSPEVRQPFTLNGTAWITADARIDGRAVFEQLHTKVVVCTPIIGIGAHGKARPDRALGGRRRRRGEQPRERGQLQVPSLRPSSMTIPMRTSQ